MPANISTNVFTATNYSSPKKEIAVYSVHMPIPSVHQNNPNKILSLPRLINLWEKIITKDLE